MPLPAPPPACRWHIIANDELARNAAAKVKEGLIYQVSGTLLQQDSLQVSGRGCCLCGLGGWVGGWVHRARTHVWQSAED